MCASQIGDSFLGYSINDVIIGSALKSASIEFVGPIFVGNVDQWQPPDSPGK